jgi:hypothetical protein
MVAAALNTVLRAAALKRDHILVAKTLSSRVLDCMVEPSLHAIWIGIDRSPQTEIPLVTKFVACNHEEAQLWLSTGTSHVKLCYIMSSCFM